MPTLPNTMTCPDCGGARIVTLFRSAYRTETRACRACNATGVVSCVAVLCRAAQIAVRVRIEPSADDLVELSESIVAQAERSAERTATHA